MARRPFNEVLKKLRTMAGLSQDALAAQSGYSSRMIKYLEGGDKEPSRDGVQRLYLALSKHVEVEWSDLMATDLDDVAHEMARTEE